jgi:hypothetical protein
LGIAGSNFVGTHANSLNPANVVDTRTKLFVNLAAVGVDFQNNYARWGAPFSFPAFSTNNVADKHRNAAGLIIWRGSYIGQNENKKKVSTFINGEGRGPAIQFDIKKWGLGVAAGVKYKYLTSLVNASPEVGRMIVEGTRSPSLIGNTYNNSEFYFNTGFYNEFFGTIGKVILNEDDRFIKIGATGKYLVSEMFTNISAYDFDFNVVSDPANNRRQIINLPKTNAYYAQVAAEPRLSISSFTNQMTKLSGLGTGFGGELGIIYEYRPDFRNYTRINNGKIHTDPRVNKYKYRLGFSLLDVGFIRYSSPQAVRVNEINSVNNRIIRGDYNMLSGFEELITSTEEVYDVDPTTHGNTFLIYTPASAVATIDYNIKDNYFVNVIIRQSLLNTNRRGAITYSGISVVPRYETKNLMISAPVSLDHNYQNFNLGLAVRFANVFLGSDNITGWLNTFNPRGFSIYAGIFLPLYHRLPQSPLKCFYEEPLFKKKRYKKRL